MFDALAVCFGGIVASKHWHLFLGGWIIGSIYFIKVPNNNIWSFYYRLKGILYALIPSCDERLWFPNWTKVHPLPLNQSRTEKDLLLSDESDSIWLGRSKLKRETLTIMQCSGWSNNKQWIWKFLQYFIQLYQITMLYRLNVNVQMKCTYIWKCFFNHRCFIIQVQWDFDFKLNPNSWPVSGQSRWWPSPPSHNSPIQMISKWLRSVLSS